MFVEHKEAGEVKEAPAKVLKLSEAMRIGATLRPKGRIDLFYDGKSCALGAAFEGATGRTCNCNNYDAVRDVFPVLKKNYGRGNLMKEIYDRNDNLGYTREQIADWLESQGY